LSCFSKATSDGMPFLWVYLMEGLPFPPVLAAKTPLIGRPSLVAALTTRPAHRNRMISTSLTSWRLTELGSLWRFRAELPLLPSPVPARAVLIGSDIELTCSNPVGTLTENCAFAGPSGPVWHDCPSIGRSHECPAAPRFPSTVDPTALDHHLGAAARISMRSGVLASFERHSQGG